MTVHVARLQLNTETDNPEVPKAVGTADCCLAYDYRCLAQGGTDECEGMFYYDRGQYGGWRGRHGRLLHLRVSPKASRDVSGVLFLCPSPGL